jgi:hypothetical protein
VAGAALDPSTTTVRPVEREWITIAATPPIPLMAGSTTPMAKAVATAASTALPPARRHSGDHAVLGEGFVFVDQPLALRSIHSFQRIMRIIRLLLRSRLSFSTA